LQILNTKNPVISLHLIFTPIALIFFLLPISLGKSIFFSVILYHLLFLIFIQYYKLTEWKWIYFYLAPLSFFLVFPDLFLSNFLGVLVFPNSGFFHWISVSDYMAGMWVIPLFLTLQIGKEISKKYSDTIGSICAAVFAAILFSLSEEFCALIPIWYAKNVRMLSHVALYVIIPEGILGYSVFWMYEKVKGNLGMSFLGSFLTSMIYTGSLVFFYYFIEIVLLKR
jgi:hypothetical protein